MNLGAEDITPGVDRILNSSGFRRSERLSHFLRFICESALNEKHDQLKEYVIGVEVYRRGADFDPRLDSVVRVEASRLRAKLREYYDSEGLADPIRIELPKGRYMPVFRKAEPKPPPARRVPGQGAWLVTGLLFVAGLALIPFYLRLNTEARAVAMPRPLTTWSGREVQPVVSPDGLHVAMAWSGANDDNFDIYVLRIGGDSPRRLTSNPATDRSPAWSPDGQRIAFIRDEPTGRQLRIVDAVSGTERAIATLKIPSMMPTPNNPRWVAWLPDGLSVLVADRESSEGPTSIFLVSVETGEKRKLTSPPAGWSGDRDPMPSADGRFLAFTRSSSPASTDIYLVPMAGGAPRRLTSEGLPVRGIAWSEGEREIVFSSERAATAGAGSLWRIAIAPSSKPPRIESVAGVGTRASLPSISRSGRILVYQESFQDGNLWRAPVDGRAPPELVVASTREEGCPDYSPDGRQMAFASNRSGSWEIWVAASDGSEPRQITHFGGTPSGDPRWSADGRTIAFSHLTAEGSSDIYTMTPDGASIRRLTTEPSHDESPSWSREGQWIYFSSNRTGSFELWKLKADEPGQAVQVTRAGGIEPLEAPDGEHLYFRRSGGSEIWKIPVRGGAESLVLKLAPSQSWLVGQRGILVTDPAVGIVHHRFGSLQALPVVPLVKATLGRMALSPDGRWLLFGKRDRIGSDIMAIENFR